MELSRCNYSPAIIGPTGPSTADLVAIDGQAGPSMAAMDGPLCHKWPPPINFAVNTECTEEGENSEALQCEICMLFMGTCRIK